MGIGGIGTTQLLIIFGIAILIFGSKKIRHFGSDLGGMIRGFRSGFKDAEDAVNEIDKSVDD